MSWSIAVHGGAGTWEKAAHEAARKGVRAAAEAGAEALRGGAGGLGAASRNALMPHAFASSASPAPVAHLTAGGAA